MSHYGGNTNKNIGEAFLVVWKLPNEESEQETHKQSTPQSKLRIPEDDWEDYFENEQMERSRKDPIIQKTCERAIISFIEIVLTMWQSDSIKNFLNIFSQTQQKQIKPNKVIHLGLHKGWSIEGAIGSQHKIDISYLSQNVNIASRICQASLQYKKELLISNEVMDECSESFKKHFRRID